VTKHNRARAGDSGHSPCARGKLRIAEAKTKLIEKGFWAIERAKAVTEPKVSTPFKGDKCQFGFTKAVRLHTGLGQKSSRPNCILFDCQSSGWPEAVNESGIKSAGIPGNDRPCLANNRAIRRKRDRWDEIVLGNDFF